MGVPARPSTSIRVSPSGYPLYSSPGSSPGCGVPLLSLTLSRHSLGSERENMSRVEIKQAAIAKQVLNTTDEQVLDHVRALLDVQNKDWWQSLPAKFRKDV